MPKVVDNFLSDNVLTYRLLGMGRKWKGETYKVPIKLAKNNQLKAISGFDKLNRGTADTRKRLSFDLRAVSIPVVIPGLERIVNQGESQILGLVDTELESSAQDLMDGVADIFYQDGTGTSNKEFLGLVAHADNGTNVSSIGNLSRSTYPTLAGQYIDFDAGLTLARMATLITGVSGGSARSQRPTMLLSSENEWDLFEQLLTPTQKANYESFGYPRITRRSKYPVRGDQMTGEGGYEALVYRGIPWVADEKGTQENIWALNEDYLFWAGARDPKMKQVSISGSTHDGAANDAPTGNTGVQWTGFMDSDEEYGEVAHLFLIGNTIGTQPRRQGRAYNVDEV